MQQVRSWSSWAFKQCFFVPYIFMAILLSGETWKRARITLVRQLVLTLCGLLYAIPVAELLPPLSTFTAVSDSVVAIISGPRALAESATFHISFT